MTSDLDPIFNPDSIALVGASNMPAKWGSFLLSHLMGGGYARDRIFPVNPRETEIHGLPAYASLADLPRKVDLVIVTTPAKLVAGILEECAAQDLKHVVVISSDFSEVGPEGAALEREIAEVARKHGLNMVGPNTMGIINTRRDIYAVGAPLQLVRGNIAYVSQSGNVGAQMLGWTMSQGIGFGKFVGSGNEATLHCEDFIRYFGDDSDTDLILAYIEGLDDGRNFVEVVREVAKRKPIIALKSGRTEAGMKAAASHTGALAGSDHIYEAAFQQSGIIRADTTQEMLDLAKAVSRLPLPRGNRVGIITLGGGWGVIATDAAAQCNLVLPPPDENVTRVCDEYLPAFWSHGNPIDLVGNFNTEGHLRIIEEMMKSPSYDSVVVLGSLGTGSLVGMSVMVSDPIATGWDQQQLKNFLVDLKEKNRTMLDRMLELSQAYGKPLVNVEMQFIGDEALVELEGGRGAIFTSPEKAAQVIAKMLRYAEFLEHAGSKAPAQNSRGG